jgi:hypothetical protein
MTRLHQCHPLCPAPYQGSVRAVPMVREVRRLRSMRHPRAAGNSVIFVRPDGRLCDALRLSTMDNSSTFGRSLPMLSENVFVNGLYSGECHGSGEGCFEHSTGLRFVACQGPPMSTKLDDRHFLFANRCNQSRFHHPLVVLSHRSFRDCLPVRPATFDPPSRLAGHVI